MSRKKFFNIIFYVSLGTILMPMTFIQAARSSQHTEAFTMNQTQLLTQQQQAIIPIAAFAAVGDLHHLNNALNHGLDVGLTINEIKEILTQVYAYAGFPRSINALGIFMSILEERQQKGLNDKEGPAPSAPIPMGNELLLLGTANQTKLAGEPVSGKLFDFAPAIDNYLKTHLFGDIFARDNLSWQDREIATIAMLAVINGAEPQLKAHINIGMNIKLTENQLRTLIDVLAKQVSIESADRTQAALSQILKK